MNNYQNCRIANLFICFNQFSVRYLGKLVIFVAEMKKILKVSNPNDYARHVGAPVLHQQLCMISYDEVSPIRSSLNSYEVYGLFIQREFPDNLSYGIREMKASDASIIAVAPGQLGGAEDNGELLTLSGWALLWSPELLHHTDLESRMRDYRFFSYFFTESLRMTPDEWDSIMQLLALMRKELVANNATSASRDILLGYLRLVLEYCNRIYQRQLSEESLETTDLLKRFHALLEQYFIEGRQHRLGLPTVAYCASELAYSPHYFGDLIHRMTGTTAISYIHSYVINVGKILLMQGHNISETSNMLGFEFPHHFTRLFKKTAGITPSQFIGKATREGG